MEPTLDTWTSLFLIVVAQGLFLASMIFLRKSKANNLLGFLILSFSLCLLCYIGYWTNYAEVIPWWINTLTGLTYTFGPLMYFYIRSTKNKLHFHGWHFIPFILYIIHFQNLDNYPQNWQQNIRLGHQILQCSHLFIYSILILRFVNNHKGYSNGELKLYNWRRKLAIAFIAYTISFLVYFILVWFDLLLIEYDYLISFTSSFFIYFIGYQSFHKKDIFLIYENGRYEKSRLQINATNAILDTVKKKMKVDRIYLDSSLRLPDLAKKLNLSQHYISQAINNLEGKNFADFINEYRIEEAKEMLIKSDKKVIHIAYDSGFNNKNSFNNAFKRFTGMSPSEFKKNRRSN